MTPMESEILEALKAHPDGATSKQIAAQIGWKHLKASRWLGSLFFAGKVIRHEVRTTSIREYVYRLAPPKIEAPASQWQPEPRFAQPYDAEAV